MDENRIDVLDPTINLKKIDHIAIAVTNLEDSIEFFTNTLGFNLIRRLKVHGERTGMISAEIEHNNIKFVLCQGTEPESQVSRLIEHFGVGVAHIAFSVDDINLTVNSLNERGLQFDTNIIKGPGLKQVFSSREPHSGLCFEFIERGAEENFLEENVQDLFSQLEKKGVY
jgi:4-hydroxyphenylpyruvate dioxygenase-like putative hemolysin